MSAAGWMEELVRDALECSAEGCPSSVWGCCLVSPCQVWKARRPILAAPSQGPPKGCQLPQEAGHQPGRTLRGVFRASGARLIFSCGTPRPVGPEVSAAFRDTACGTGFQPPSESHTLSSFHPHFSCLLVFHPQHNPGPPLCMRAQ